MACFSPHSGFYQAHSITAKFIANFWVKDLNQKQQNVDDSEGFLELVWQDIMDFFGRFVRAGESWIHHYILGQIGSRISKQ